MKRLYPPTYFLLALVSITVLHFVLPILKVIPFPWNLAGILPLAAGIVLNLLADRSFKKQGTTVKPFEESTALITSGVFRMTRHPMYVGMTLILAGLAIILGTLTPWVVVVLFALAMDMLFIRAEEPMMERTFGDAYRRYKAQVRRWI
jgi:protein-S-isoprenylcysteine O-methyltransferase Ste14